MPIINALLKDVRKRDTCFFMILIKNVKTIYMRGVLNACIYIEIRNTYNVHWNTHLLF